ncbi:MAG: hypothetical protein L0Z50_42225 [Verrucomicrobiales bacterium]|nr:hypothetical protein [Verrucomicrobiales bacterium]
MNRCITRKLLQSICAVVAVTAKANLTATTYNLGTLVTSGDSISIGDKVFDDFGFASGDFSANDATVTPSIDASGVYYLTFETSWSADGFFPENLLLQYSVATASRNPLINMIDQSFEPTVGGRGGLIHLVEFVRTGGFDGTQVAASALTLIGDSDSAAKDLEDPVAENEDDLDVDPSEARLWVTTDVLFSPFGDGSIGVKTFRQSFHQTGTSVPEGGGTGILFGAALGGLSLVHRFLRRSELLARGRRY